MKSNTWLTKVFLLIGIVLMIIVGINYFRKAQPATDATRYEDALQFASTTPYSEFQAYLFDGKVDTVYYEASNEMMVYTLHNDESAGMSIDERKDYEHPEEDYRQTFYPSGEEFRKEILFYDVRLVLIRDGSERTFQIIISLLPTLILVSAYIWFMVFMSKKHIIGFNEKDIIQKSDVKFSDIIGLDEIINELHVIVKTIKDPEFGEALGVKPSKGILLSGVPGVGKTMIAKAIACEADLPFISLSGSDFKEIFVGNGARKIRQTFKTAREHSPCIVFIDEIDAIGASRDNVLGGTNEESNQTIDALLKEMDGFTGREGIFVLAATNHPELLDSAIVRSGRFDREIIIQPPKDWHTRLKMFEAYLKDKPLADDVDLETIAKITTGFTGADISTVCNESGLIALYKGKESIDHASIEEAIDKKILKGNRTKNDDHEADKAIVAYHEAGHAVMSILQGLPVARASIIPTTSGVGGAVFREDSDSFFTTKDELVSQIFVAYAGRASEQIKFKRVTTGASNDITQATDILKKMIGRYGFDEEVSGLLDMNVINYDNEFMDLRMRELSVKYYDECKKLLQDNYSYVETLAQMLLEEESLTGAQIKEHLGYIKQVG